MITFYLDPYHLHLVNVFYMSSTKIQVFRILQSEQLQIGRILIQKVWYSQKHKMFQLTLLNVTPVPYLCSDETFLFQFFPLIKQGFGIDTQTLETVVAMGYLAMTT